MKTVNAVAARRGLGRLLNLVSLRHETIIIERAGEKLAVLKPYEETHDQPPAAVAGGRLNLVDLAGVGSEIWVDVDGYVQREREQWT